MAAAREAAAGALAVRAVIVKSESQLAWKRRRTSPIPTGSGEVTVYNADCSPLKAIICSNGNSNARTCLLDQPDP